MPPSPATSVVDLTPTSLPTVLPLLLLVNICRPSCGFCQALLPTWEKLARRLRNEVVVASWDAAAHPRLPELLGVANATPTIRALVPAADPAAVDAATPVVQRVSTRVSNSVADKIERAHVQQRLQAAKSWALSMLRDDLEPVRRPRRAPFTGE